MSLIFLVGAGILLFGLGLGLGYWFARSQSLREASKASSIQKELDDYRRDVSNHFSETAAHFRSLGQQYQSLYKHMAQGAESLCDSSQSYAVLGFAADAAPAVTVETMDEAEIPPEVVGDHPFVEETAPQAQAEADAAATSEAPEPSTVPAGKADESTEEEVIAEQIVAPPPAETERSVH